MNRFAVCIALACAACGGSPVAPTAVPQANVQAIGKVNWGYRPGDGFSAFSGQVQNVGPGCAGPLVSGVATLVNGTATVSSGEYLVATNSVTRVMRPGEIANYSGNFVPAVPPGTEVTGATFTVNFTTTTCPP